MREIEEAWVQLRKALAVALARMCSLKEPQGVAEQVHCLVTMMVMMGTWLLWQCWDVQRRKEGELKNDKRVESSWQS